MTLVTPGLDDHGPSDLRDLNRGEHLLLFAFRAMAVGQADCPLVRQTFTAACRGQADEAWMALFVLVQHIGQAGRRRLKLHTPGCPCVSDDERALIALFASAQESIRTGEEGALRRRYAELADGGSREGYLLAAQLVARALAVSGHRLPVRLDVLPAEAPPPPTLH